MRPAGTHGEDEIAPTLAAFDRAHHFDPSNPERQRAALAQRPRREPQSPARRSPATKPFKQERRNRREVDAGHRYSRAALRRLADALAPLESAARLPPPISMLRKDA